MASLRALFISFDGRIPRSRFWLGAVLLFVVSLVLSAALMAGGLSYSATQSGTVTTNGVTTSFEGMRWTLSPLGALILSLVTAAPAMALGVKRRKDRDFPGGDVTGFIAASLLVRLLDLFGLKLPLADVVLAIWGLVLVILLGVLAGTRGPNRFGPDPLAPELVRVPPVTGQNSP